MEKSIHIDNDVIVPPASSSFVYSFDEETARTAYVLHADWGFCILYSQSRTCSDFWGHRIRNVHKISDLDMQKSL